MLAACFRSGCRAVVDLVTKGIADHALVCSHESLSLGDVSISDGRLYLGVFSAVVRVVLDGIWRGFVAVSAVDG